MWNTIQIDASIAARYVASVDSFGYVEPMPHGNMRRHERVPASHKLVLSWIDADGTHKVVRGKCLDISTSGMKIESPEPIEVRSNVSFRGDTPSLSGSGSVRYCVHKGLKYWIGVEFASVKN
jgi:hypothetical protein